MKLAFILVALLLVVNLMLDLTDVLQGPVPLLAWIGAAALGFVLPDLALAARLRQRRTEILGELPILADLLSAASSADRGTSAAETSDVLSAADGLDLFIDGWYVVV